MTKFIFKNNSKFLSFYLKFIFVFIIFIFINNNISAQCDQTLVERAIENSGSDVIFVRDFKIKNTKERLKSLSPLISYEVTLNQGLTYRFYVENEKNYEGEAILQIYEDNMLLASTFNLATYNDEKSFDFLCSESGTYELIMSFKEPVTGCAVGIMSVVITDSIDFSELIKKNDFKNIIYAGIDNYLEIVTTSNKANNIEVAISNGLIEKKDELYKVRVENEGFVTIEAIAKDSLGTVIETIKKNFVVKKLVLPRLTLDGISGGIISKSNFKNSFPKLELNYLTDAIEFEIIEFTISKNPYSGGIKAINTNFLNNSQIRLIEELNYGENFYITNIKIRDANGTEYELDKIGFILDE